MSAAAQSTANRSIVQSLFSGVASTVSNADSEPVGSANCTTPYIEENTVYVPAPQAPGAAAGPLRGEPVGEDGGPAVAESQAGVRHVGSSGASSRNPRRRGRIGRGGDGLPDAVCQILSELAKKRVPCASIDCTRTCDQWLKLKSNTILD